MGVGEGGVGEPVRLRQLVDQPLQLTWIDRNPGGESVQGHALAAGTEASEASVWVASVRASSRVQAVALAFGAPYPRSPSGPSRKAWAASSCPDDLGGGQAGPQRSSEAR